MRNSKFIICFVAILALALAAGCGGGGQGLRIPSSPLAITSSSIPAHLSGEYIDWEIPITGGCGGPYVVEVIAGNLPLGVGAVADTEHALRGYILDDGIFSFTVKITDTTCDPFFTATQAFVWDVQQGPVKIVAANPGIVLNADYDDPQKHDNEPGPDTILGTEDDITIDALETVVFNTFVSYQLIAAGGVGPYTCAVIDDPSDALDGALPLGTSMAPLSCSLVGSPAQVLAGGVPFRLTIRVTDSVGNTSVRKFQWKIDTPPIIIANSALVNGKCGTWFSDAVQLVDGVPPFRFELTDNAPGDDGNPDTTDNQNDDITYPPGFTPVVNTYVNGALPFQLTPTGPTALARLHQTTGRVLYPAQTDNGPNYSPMPSEGLYFREAGAGAGSFFGVPRRRGTFTIFVHAFSTLVPNERGQHAFKALSHTIDPSEPPTGLNPAFDMDPAFTLQGAFNPAAPHGTLAEAEVTVLYNPDSGSGHAANGLKLLGQGGVPQDGYIDAPHEANQLPTFAEVDGEYSWTYDPLTPLPGMTLFAGVPGTFGTATPADANELIRSGSRPIRFGITDEILPLSVRAATNTRTRDFNISVGPDLVIITESTQSFTGTSTTGTNQADMHDREIKVRGFEVLGGSGVVTDLKDGNMSTNHVVPAIAGLAGTDQVGKLLSGTTPGDATRDLLRISVNPGGWWDDQGNMNPKGARAHMGADKNAGQTYVQANGWYNSGGGWHAGVSGVDLPNTPSIAHDPASGIFADGGRMFAFNSGNRFGLFVIRGNASVYVPFAIQRGTLGIWQFGDGMTFAGSTDSNFLTVPLAVSPDGRFATVKVIKTTSNALTTMSSWNNAVLVLISLTGEKFASGDTYQIIDTNLASEGGSYMYSTSMVMNDQMLYFLSGNYATTYASWRDHYIHQYRYRSTGGVLVAPGGNAGAVAQLASGIGGNWTQATFTPMQTPFHKWDNPTSQSNTFLSSGGFGIVTIPNNDMYLYDGWNMGENSTAPVPFRSSADGKHMALLAGPRSASTSGTDVMSHFCWVSSNGGDFRQASTVARHSPGGASRGYGLARGPTAYYHWGRFSGPTPGLEIADNGTAVAFRYNRLGSVSSTSNTSNWNNEREDVIVVKGNGAASDPFTSSTETEVTKDIFGGAIKWRFGSLVFTEDNQGLIFWGGASAYTATTTDATSSGYPAAWSVHFLGTYYAYNLSVANQVRGVMPATAGGVGSFPTYSSGSPFAPATPNWTTNMGTIKPYGGFLSRNRDYFYVVNYHPNTSSDQTSLTLLGINIENLSNSSTPSGNVRGRGFKTSGFPARRGFLPSYYYQPHYALSDGYYNPHHTHGGGMQAMHKDTGNVFFMSHYATNGPSNTTGTFGSGPVIPTYWGDYGYRGFHLEGFSADVGGPITRLTHSGLGSDTASRSGQYFTMSADGGKIAYVYQNTATSRTHNQERIGVVTNIGFHPTSGAPNPAMDNGDANKAYEAETSTGRAGESMAFDSGGTKLFYAFKSGAGNENARELVEMTQNPSTGARTFRRVLPARRYNVLYAGR